VGHGSPTNAIEDNEFSRAWADMGRALPRPEAILCVSAHWATAGTHVTAMETPKTIHDFYGFPRPLHEMRYPAPGSPSLTQRIRASVRGADVRLDQD
jgi:4,5-DOPA dioxygenase extradiol